MGGESGEVRRARRSAALLVALAAALALVTGGCGGESGDEGGSGDGGQTAARGQEPQREATQPRRQDDGAQQGGEPPQNDSSRGRPGGRGGEASIEDFGSEATGGGREAVLDAFRGYLSALAAENYARACAGLAAHIHGSLRQLVAGGDRSVGCPKSLPRLLAPTATTIAREQAGGEVTRVRAQGDDAFVVFRAPGAKLYQLTMLREEGDWKAATVAASVLVPDL